MKKLNILRHAKSKPDETGIGDFSRPLAHRGWSDSEHMGAKIKRLGLSFDFVIASPAKRCRETLKGLVRRLDIDVEPQFDERLYLADIDTLLSIIRTFPGDVQSPLIVGHNPGLQEIVLELSEREGDFAQEIAAKFPTAAFTELELPIQQRDAVQPGKARIRRLILPRALN